jgi:hypothetical protein
MPRRNLSTPAARTGLLAFPATDDELIQHYTFAEPDLPVIRHPTCANGWAGRAWRGWARGRNVLPLSLQARTSYSHIIMPISNGWVSSAWRG